MESNSKNMSTLAEESLEEELQSEEPKQPPLPSAFASLPQRPPTQSSLEKYAPLDWVGYFDEEKDISIPDSNDVFHVYMAGTEGPVIFCLHGGGYSGLSFALAAGKIKEKARVVAMDLRGHGKSSSENDIDLSIETMCNDVLAVLKEMYGEQPPSIVLVGHSMGGSVAVHVAAKKTLRSLHGLVVVDVVEIEWSVKGGSLRNLDSARLSIPSTLNYVYRARLEETEQYWRAWYEGLSEKFLSCPVPKLLLLAGTDRLDRPLTIGQMQGKFQMVVVRHTGHAIQEDAPEEFASLILNFIARNRIGPHGVEIPGLRQPLQSQT
ncbi:hypothetical protein CUMW_218290 [Citrus unshiu]|uniref:Protein phosphatase methylesterase 1 n=1 Tax=Citrus unshiu TaxID=55188 RepID=A0A2H5QD35_CITUN|nr:hypothetical protein CUMW_218290 [Citrus unshiu]